MQSSMIDFTPSAATDAATDAGHSPHASACPKAVGFDSAMKRRFLSSVNFRRFASLQLSVEVRFHGFQNDRVRHLAYQVANSCEEE
jgi:hypothetical protein